MNIKLIEWTTGKKNCSAVPKVKLWPLWVGRDADGGRLAGVPPGQPLEQLLGDVGHEGRDEPQAAVQAGVEHAAGSQDGRGVGA